MASTEKLSARGGGGPTQLIAQVRISNQTPQ